LSGAASSVINKDSRRLNAGQKQESEPVVRSDKKMKKAGFKN
jgi:hypothetical protein